MTDKFETWETKLGLSFNPLELMAFADAVRKRETSAIIGQKTFALQYRDDHVFYTPIDGYAPTGWVNIELLEKGP